MNGLKRKFGPDIVRKTVPIRKIEDQEEVVAALVTLGEEIGKRTENPRK